MDYSVYVALNICYAMFNSASAVTREYALEQINKKTVVEKGQLFEKGKNILIKRLQNNWENDMGFHSISFFKNEAIAVHAFFIYVATAEHIEIGMPFGFNLSDTQTAQLLRFITNVPKRIPEDVHMLSQLSEMEILKIFKRKVRKLIGEETFIRLCEESEKEYLEENPFNHYVLVIQRFNHFDNI